MQCQDAKLRKVVEDDSLLLEVKHIDALLLVLSRYMDRRFQAECEAAGVVLQLVFAYTCMLQESVFCLSPIQKEVIFSLPVFNLIQFCWTLAPGEIGRKQYAINSYLIPLPSFLFSREPSAHIPWNLELLKPEFAFLWASAGLQICHLFSSLNDPSQASLVEKKKLGGIGLFFTDLWVPARFFVLL